MLRSPGWPRWLASAVLATVALTGCDSASRANANGSVTSTASSSATNSPATAAAASRVGSTPASPSTIPTPAPSATSTPSVTPPTPSNPSPAPSSSGNTAPAFSASVRTVVAADLGASWHAGCPVGPDQLREISLSYWGFDGTAHIGRIVVNASVVDAVEKAFKTLYLERFPIRSIRPVSEFGGSDDASMAVDNTSGFNCRNAVAPGKPRWSAHAYGKAIDVNTVENPYLEGGQVLPPEGAAYAKRTPYRAGMAVSGGQLVKAFAAVGWQWGGRWAAPDYQHFSSTGG